MELIFHIAEQDAWERAIERGHYVTPSLTEEGFIHCSTRAQMLETGNRYFRGRSALRLFCLDPEELGANLRYEPAAPIGAMSSQRASEGAFPHVYAAIPIRALARVVDFVANPNGEFAWPEAALVERPRVLRASDAARSVSDNLVAKDARITGFWSEFCRARGVHDDTPYDAYYFGDSAELAHELADLVVHGEKRAATTLLWSVERFPALAPVPDGYSVITELDGTPRGVIHNLSIEVRAFDAVDAAYAWEEGEGDRSLASWRADHRAFYAAECARLDRTPSDAMRVICERFELSFGDANAGLARTRQT